MGNRISRNAGEAGGPDGIKLEEQILVTEDAPVVLSTAPFQDAWL